MSGPTLSVLSGLLAARAHTPLFGTTRVVWYQKGKTNSGFYWSKRQWVAVASAVPYASLHLAQEITMPAPHHLVFYRPDALPAAQPTASKHWRQQHCDIFINQLLLLSQMSVFFFNFLHSRKFCVPFFAKWCIDVDILPSLLWHCWLGDRKGIRPVKNWVMGCWCGYLSGARTDLHMAQLIPLPLTVFCFSKIQIGFTFLVPGHAGSLGQRAVKRVFVCVCMWCINICCNQRWMLRRFLHPIVIFFSQHMLIPLQPVLL